MESVCSFSNEPGLGGGYILLGVGENKNSAENRFPVEGVDDCDKKQLDISSQCASMFNIAVRPKIDVEKINGINVLKIFVPELPSQQKPLYFKKDGLPKGAWRRIGSSDQHCTEEDLFTFYRDDSSFDSGIVNRSSIKDVDENAVEYYRILRGRVNGAAEELKFNNKELLKSLNCLTDSGELTYAGLLMFGTKQSHRKFCPMTRVDYIRIHGNEWVENPDERFSTIEFTGSYLLSLDKIIDAVMEELPHNFSLKEGQIQATTKTCLPSRVLRESIVNALMHRSYRRNRPTQIIRYNNRIEIINSGYSLKDQESIGTAGSDTRNLNLATIFHETNLAETKGTGIRTMRRLLTEAEMPLPTFESDRKDDTFTIRLLIKPFFSEENADFLKLYKKFNFTENQQKGLLFTMEVGAVDAVTYSQLNNVSLKEAEEDLSDILKTEVIIQKGKKFDSYFKLNQISRANLPSSVQISQALQEKINKLGKKATKTEIEEIVLELCRIRPRTRKELSEILKRSEEYFRKEILSDMIGKTLERTIPDSPTAPNQAYKAK